MGSGSLYKILQKDELVGLVTNELFTSSVKSIRHEPKACTSDLRWKLFEDELMLIILIRSFLSNRYCGCSYLQWKFA